MLITRMTGRPVEPAPSLCFFEKNVLITSGPYECSYNQRNYLVFWKFVLTVDVLIIRFLYDVLITRVLITRADCSFKIKRLFLLRSVDIPLQLTNNKKTVFE